MFSLRNKKKLALNYPQYSLLSGALLLVTKIFSTETYMKLLWK